MRRIFHKQSHLLSVSASRLRTLFCGATFLSWLRGMWKNLTQVRRAKLCEKSGKSDIARFIPYAAQYGSICSMRRSPQVVRAPYALKAGANEPWRREIPDPCPLPPSFFPCQRWPRPDTLFPWSFQCAFLAACGACRWRPLAWVRFACCGTTQSM